MRVLHIGKYFPPFAGGMEHFLRDLMSAQSSQGLKVAAVVHEHRPTHASGCECYNGLPVWRVRSFGRLLYTPISPSFPIQLRKIAREFKPDLLHLHVPNPSAFWACAVRALGAIPWVIHWQSDVITAEAGMAMRTAYRAYRPFERRLLARSAVIIVASPPYAASSGPLQPWQAKCRVVPLGLDPARVPEPGGQAIEWAEGVWRAGTLRVLVIGRLTYYKGHETLLHAIARTPGVQLCLVGDGDLRRRLAEQLSELGLRDRAQMLGFLPDDQVQALLSTADCLCLPSIERTEAFGVVLLEGMRYGKALLASDIPGSGVGWIVRQGPCGLLAAPGDVDGFAAALARFRDDPDLRDRLGTAGRAVFESRFQIDRIARQVQRVYDQVLTRKPRNSDHGSQEHTEQQRESEIEI